MSMKIVLLALALITTFARPAMAKVTEELVVECRLLRPVDEGTIAGFYRVTRFGDSLLGEYKHRAEDDLVRTDDVYYKQYNQGNFAELEAAGILDALEQASEISKVHFKTIRYWGIDEDDTSHFQMQLWLVIAEGKQRLVANWSENAFKTCQPSR